MANRDEIIYRELDDILKKLNKRYHLKFYTILFKENNDYESSYRVKKTIPKTTNDTKLKQNKKSFEVIQESITIEKIFQELNIDIKYENKYKDFYSELKETIDSNNYANKNSEKVTVNKDSHDEDMEDGDKKDSKQMNQSLNYTQAQIYYCNEFKINNSKVIYILEIRNIDKENIDIFYKQPLCSFLRILLEYYFKDYYLIDENKKLVFEKNIPKKKLKENNIGFTRRILHIFFEKILNNINDKSVIKDDLEESLSVDDNDYYANSLIEKIDNISSQTYEKASPFGSILFLNKEDLDNDKLIKYAIKFEKDDAIEISNFKRIRKLLEMANIEKDLCLISDGYEVFGLGEVIWHNVKESVFFRIDFKGLSKYDLVCQYIEENNYKDGIVLVENDRKIYECRKSINIAEKNLISVNSKNPRLKNEYTPEKLESALTLEFFVDESNESKVISDTAKEYIDKLKRIVNEARKQKHGTMVVITDTETAEDELKLLKSQSTSIETKEIDTKYIKYLTSIDGAIYFDTKGNCHAIGVILDGEAKEGLGDSSRGARYNSAYRYLNKLNNNEKKCVIAIISEDGIVDIIPELDNEDKIFDLSQEIIDLNIEELTEEKEIVKEKVKEKLSEKEDEFNKYNIWNYQVFFEIGDAIYNVKKYDKASEYYNKGIETAKEQNSYVTSTYYNQLANCYHFKQCYEDAIACYREAIERDGKESVFWGNITHSLYRYAENMYKNNKKDNAKEFFEKVVLSVNEYEQLIKKCEKSLNAFYINLRGISRDYLSIINNDKNYRYKSIEDYTIAIKQKENEVYYRNRGVNYKILVMMGEALKDFISSIIFSNNDAEYYNENIENIKVILKKNIDLIELAVEHYNKLCSENKELEKILDDFVSEKQKSLDEVAADKEEIRTLEENPC